MNWREMDQYIVDAILYNLQGRSGFDEWWGDIDEDIQDEIQETLRYIVAPMILVYAQEYCHHLASVAQSDSASDS